MPFKSRQERLMRNRLLVVLALLLGVAPEAGAASTYGYYGQSYMTTAFNYDALAYNNAPVGTGGMMHRPVDGTCMQCHAAMANAPIGNTYAFEAYLYSYYAAQYASAGYNADVAGNTSTARTYYYYAYTYAYYASYYGYSSSQGQFFNGTGATEAYYGYYYAYYGCQYLYYASQGL
jgi:hypothetical protein